MPVAMLEGQLAVLEPPERDERHIKIESGTVWINHWGRGEDMTSPFGGVKRSGIGKALGRAGYEKYLKSKSVWVELGEPI